jgi:hypothetical protein
MLSTSAGVRNVKLYVGRVLDVATAALLGGGSGGIQQTHAAKRR